MATQTDDVERLRNHLVGAVQRALRMCNSFTLLVDEETPSAVLAALARDQSDVPFSLLHLSATPDPSHAPRRLAKRLGLPLLERHVVAHERARAAAEVSGLGLSQTEEAVGFALAAREARLQGPRLILARGAADALGPHPAADAAAAPERQAESQIADAQGLQLRYPFLDRGVTPFADRLRQAAPDRDPWTLLEGLRERLGIRPL